MDVPAASPRSIYQIRLKSKGVELEKFRRCLDQSRAFLDEIEPKSFANDVEEQEIYLKRADLLFFLFLS